MKKFVAMLLAMMLLCTVCFAAAEETGAEMNLTVDNIDDTAWMKSHGWNVPETSKQSAEEKAQEKALVTVYEISEGISFKCDKLVFKTGTAENMYYILKGTETLDIGVQPAVRAGYIVLNAKDGQTFPTTVYEKKTVLGTWIATGKALQSAAKYDDPFYDKYFTECAIILELREDGTYTLINRLYTEEKAEEGTWTGTDKDFTLGETKEKVASVSNSELSIAEGNLKVTFTSVDTAEPVVREAAPAAEAAAEEN